MPSAKFVGAALLLLAPLTAGCAGVLGIDEATDELAPPASVCDGGVEVQTSDGKKCVHRYKLTSD